MALQAVFSADFSAFEKSLQQATVKLTVFDSATKNATRGLKREIESISGQKVAVEAARMAEAVQRLGGAGGTAAGLLKLLPEELRRVSATMEIAAQKAGLLGEKLPASLQKVRDEIAKLPPATSAATTGFGSLGSVLGKLGPLLPVASLTGAAAALLRLGANAFESASKISDLANRTGLSTTAIQQMQAVANQTGTSVDAFAKSATMLGVNIANGTAKARDAIQDLGLSFTHLKNLKPEDQFHAVIAALEKEENVAQRNAMGRALFGKQWDEISASIAEGYSKIAGAASVSSAEQIAALDRAGDAWQKLKDDVGTSVTSILGSIAIAIQEIEKGADSLSNTQKLRLAITSTLSGKGYLAELREIGQALAAAEQEQKKQQTTTANTTAATEDYVAALNRAKGDVRDLSTVQRDQLNAALKLGGDAAQEYADSIGLSSEALRLFQAPIKGADKSLRDADAAARAFAQSVEQLSGAGALKSAADGLMQLAAAGGLLGVLPSKMKGLADTFTQAAEAAMLMGKVKLAQQYRELALTLTPVVQFQQRYNVTIGEYIALNPSYISAIQEQAQGQDELTTEINLGILAITNYTAAWVPFKAAVVSAIPGIQAANKEIASAERRAAVQEQVRAMQELAQSFSQLAQVTDSDLVRSLAEITNLMAIGGQAGLAFNEGLNTLREGGIANVIAGLTQMAAAGAAAVGALAQATDRAGRGKRAAAGALTGAQIGGAIVPGWGHLVGAAVGALVGALRNPAFEDVMKRVGQEWGVKISEGLARQIADDAKKLFKGNRQAAEIFNIGNIIEEAGGLNDVNFDRFISRMRDVFVMFAEGKFSLAQTQEVLNKSFDTFANHILQTGQIASREFVELIRLNHDMGIDAESILNFVESQAGRAGQAIADLFRDTIDNASELSSRLKEAQGALDQLRKAATPDPAAIAEAERLVELLSTDLKNAAKNSQEEFDRLGVLALGAFNAAIAGGLSFQQALAAAAPSLDAITKLMTTLGLEADNAALKALLTANTVAQTSAGAAAGALNEAILALSNFGALNEQTLDALEGQLGTIYTRIQSQVAALGGDTADALRQVLPFLQQVILASEEYGLTIDPATQALIDQARELGLLGDVGESQTSILKEGFKDVAAAVRELTAALTGIPAAAQAAADGMSRIRMPSGNDFQPPDPNISQPLALGGNEALRQMVPVFEQVIRASEEYGLTIDPNTQALIDQARELGLLGETAALQTNVMRKGFTGVGEVVRQVTNDLLLIPAAAQAAADAISRITPPTGADFIPPPDPNVNGPMALGGRVSGALMAAGLVGGSSTSVPATHTHDYHFILVPRDADPETVIDIVTRSLPDEARTNAKHNFGTHMAAALALKR